MTAPSQDFPAASIPTQDPFAPEPPPTPRPGRAPRDPGSKPAALFAWLAAILIVAAVAILQQLAAFSAPEPDPDALAAPDPTLSMMGQVMLKLEHALDDMAGPNDQRALEDLRGTISEQLNQIAIRPEDRLRLAAFDAELYGAGVALDRIEDATSPHALDQLGSDVARGLLLEDAETLTALYQQGVDTLTDDQRQALEDRHGAIAKIALAFGLDDDHPDRASVVGGGLRIMLAGLGVFIIIGGGGLIGFALLVTAIILSATGRMRPRLQPPEPGGSVYLEMLPLFAGLFLVVILALGVAQAMWSNPSDPTFFLVQAAAQWAILPCVMLWPKFRGVAFARFANDIGLHRGSGVFKEIVCGVAGWLAGLPILFVAAIFVILLGLVVEALTPGDAPAPAPQQDIALLFASGNTVAIVATVSLILIWAPLLEEIVFRGAAFRHLLSRVHWILAALATAFAFAFMHGGALLTFPMLMSLALVFSALRYWRGSLIASITAHLCQNTMATTIMLLIMPTLV